MKLKNSNSDEIQKLKLWSNSTEMVTKLKNLNSNYDQINKKNSNCYET